jgi:hypothetical protein
MESTVRNYFDRIWETSEGFRALCPRCNDTKGKLYFNEEKNVGACFHSDCQWFVERGGVTLYRLRAWFGHGAKFKEPVVVTAAEDVDVTLPDEFKVLDDLDKNTREDVMAYLESRGLSPKLLKRMKVGYCKSGRFWGYIVFPVFNEDGEVVYWQGRQFKDKKSKFYNPASSKKTDFLYQIGKAARPKNIVLVESIINAQTIGSLEPSSRLIVDALLGKTMSDTQRERILSYERYLEEITVALDPDAWRNAVQIAHDLSKTFPAVKIASFPAGTDINSLGRMKAWEFIRKAESYSRSNFTKFMTRYGGYGA